MIILTEKQQKAVDIMTRNFNAKEPVTVIAGFAGTGKSSIINYFIEENKLKAHTKFVTFTGKASLVLQNKGLPATTIHSLIYDAFKNKITGKFVFKRKESLDPSIKLIVVDEVSMVPANLLEDLKFYEIPIIALGDPGQLEPIGQDNGLLKNPDFFLDEIHRQSEDNSIIKLSMHVRQGKPLDVSMSDDNVKIVTKDQVSIAMLTWADQILCGKNATRRAINNDIRKALGHEGVYPNIGEKVICLRNYWDTVNGKNEPLINGTIGRVDRIVKPRFEDVDNILGDMVTMDVTADYSDEGWSGLITDSNIFNGHAPYAQEHPGSRRMFYEFDYGYAITTHKAQGSEFDKVLIFEERLGGGNHARWLYTAITRAAKKVVIVKE